MKRVITIFLFFISLSALCQKDTAKKASIEVPLEFKTDTVKYKRVMYVSNGFVKVDSAIVVMSGYGNKVIQGFWNTQQADNPKVKIFVANKEIKNEDFIQVISQ